MVQIKFSPYFTSTINATNIIRLKSGQYRVNILLILVIIACIFGYR
jgi:hypothetical protein